jgi:hypothetical protein
MSDRGPGARRQTRPSAAARSRVRADEPSSPRPRTARPPRTWVGHARRVRAMRGRTPSRCGWRSHSRERSAPMSGRPPLRRAAISAVITVTACIGHPLTRAHPAAPCPPRPGFEPPQAKPLLLFARRVLGSWLVVMHAGLAAILGHQAHDDMRVVRPAYGLAVTNGRPPTLCSRFWAGEPMLATNSSPTSPQRSSDNAGSAG